MVKLGGEKGVWREETVGFSWVRVVLMWAIGLDSEKRIGRVESVCLIYALKPTRARTIGMVLLKHPSKHCVCDGLEKKEKWYYINDTAKSKET